MPLCGSSVLCCGKKRNYYLPDEDWEEWAITGPFEENRKKLIKGEETSRKTTDIPQRSNQKSSSSSTSSVKNQILNEEPLTTPSSSETLQVSTPEPVVPAVSIEKEQTESVEITVKEVISISSSGSGSSMKIPPPSSVAGALGSSMSLLRGQSSNAGDNKHLSFSTTPKAKPAVQKPTTPPAAQGDAKAKAKRKAGSPKTRSANQIVHNAKSAATTGLRTTDMSKMVEMLTPGEAKYFTMAANVLRSTVNAPPTEDTNAREAAVMLFLLTYAAKLQHDGAKNIAATVISHISTHAAGDAALATKAAKEAAPQVVFYANQFYRPLVEAIIDNKATGKDWYQELSSNSKFAMGSKPKFAEERISWVSEFMKGSYQGATNTTSFETYIHALQSCSTIIDTIYHIFDEHRKGGSPNAIFNLFI